MSSRSIGRTGAPAIGALAGLASGILFIALVLGIGSAWLLVAMPEGEIPLGSWRLAPGGLPYGQPREELMLLQADGDGAQAFDRRCTYRLSGEDLPAARWTLGFARTGGAEAGHFLGGGDMPRGADGLWVATLGPDAEGPGALATGRAPGEGPGFTLVLGLHRPAAAVAIRPARLVPPRIQRLGCAGEGAPR